jgi:acyl-CoA synthetase (AMP-forming)/AMP-acid ligase II
MSTFATGAPSVAWLLGAQSLPAHIDSDAPAVRWADRFLTYGELKDRALRLAGAIRASGVQPGDRIATYLLNRGEIFDLYFAGAYAGVTVVPISFRFTAAEVARVLVDCDARWLFSQESLAPQARQAAEAASLSRLTILCEGDEGSSYEELLAAEPTAGPYYTHDPHLILFSSGTTGQPKGARLGHLAILWYAMQQATIYPHYGPEMTLLVTGPLFNTGGINDLTIATFAVGGTVSILPSHNWSAARMAEHITRWQVTHAIVFPSMMGPMLEADGRGECLDCDSLRLVVTGGETCPEATVRRFRERWQEVTLAIGYGATELGLATLIVGDDIGARPGSVGRAVAGSTIRIAGPDGTEVPTGQVGEVWMAGPSAFSGYHNAFELTSATLRDDWVVSGDLGHLDEDGFLYLDGRAKDMIISGGQNIYPAEIEHVLSEYDALAECAVVGVPDKRWGEAVCAVVVQRPGHSVSARQVIEYVAERIGSYKKPTHVVFVDHLPRSALGKVSKQEIREELAASGVAEPRLE